MLKRIISVSLLYRIKNKISTMRGLKNSNLVSFIRPIAAALAVAVVLTACSSQEIPEAVPEEVIPVRTAAVEKGSIQNVISYSGQVVPDDEAAVYSTISGKVERVYFDVGDRVKKGDVLLTMDKRNIQDNIKNLKAQLASAQAAVRAAETAVDNVTGGQWQNQMLTATAAIDRAQLSLDESKRNYENARQMYELDAISSVELHQSEVAVQNAQLAYDQAVESYNIASERIAEDNFASADNARAQAQAQVNTINVQIANATAMLSDASVKSPIAGIVSARAAKDGGVLGASSAAFTIVNIDKVEYVVKVTESVINKLSVGQEIQVKISAASGDAFVGVVDNIPPMADQSKTFPVRVVIDNKDLLIKAGMFGTVDIVLESHNDVVIVPRSAVMTDEEGDCVFVTDNDTAKKVRVETLLDDGRNVEIASGLEAGQALIVSGQTYVNDGKKIKIITDVEG
ncbi:secretion protein HlyD [Clostridia bacterium]|nr:secretion protein HlyD [Clostridia bacterium]